MSELVYTVYFPNVTYLDKKDIIAILAQNSFLLKSDIRLFYKKISNNTEKKNVLCISAVMDIVPIDKNAKNKIKNYLKKGKFIYLNKFNYNIDYKIMFCSYKEKQKINNNIYNKIIYSIFINFIKITYIYNFYNYIIQKLNKIKMILKNISKFWFLNIIMIVTITFVIFIKYYLF